MITAHEYSLSTGQPTGLQMLFESMTGVLYTARLKDGRAEMGATGLVVYPHGRHADIAWVCIPEAR